MARSFSIHFKKFFRRHSYQSLLLSALVALAACQVMDTANTGDSGSPIVGMTGDSGTPPTGTTDAGGTVAAAYPSWKLLELRSNETKGLDAFAGRPLVVTLLEGF